MASLQIHKEHITEHVQELTDAIAIGVEKRAVTIGLHASACSIELLELYLHVLGKISAGAMIKHEWFKSPKPEQKIAPLAERKIMNDFPNKVQLLSLMYIIEEERNKLIYGRPNLTALEAVLNSFNKLHQIIKDRLKEEGEEIA
ncbi:hypothetical protein HYU21_01940 [Candidatus Woesearchaeota archaeon]|nr:hypothetical protein [Candidatus Woesearchaeota archaeon]